MEFKFMTNVNWLGSNFAYRTVSLDLRKYVTPLKWLTIAGQFYSEANFGEVPVQSLAMLGGSDRMRGIYIGRFRDMTKIETQLELRFPIIWLIGGTVFTGLGEVAPEISKYSLQGIKWTYGLGLRMSVNEATRTNMRFDLGFYEGRSQFFFTFSEAF
jgi:outer membrane protein assembly factor BamA